MWYTADVLDNPAEGAFDSRLALLESADGARWPGPYRRPENVAGILFGASVIDDGPRHPQPAERYKIIYYSQSAPGQKAGPVVAFSPDGLQWTMHERGKPVLPNTGDSWHAAYDPIRKRYFLIGKQQGNYQWTNSEGKAVNKNIRRYLTSFSQDFKNWSATKLVFSPDALDPGITEWYGMVGFQVRGDLIVGFLQVLRDDLSAEGAPPEAVACNLGNAGAGVGYTVLAWTRDGETWHRDRHTDPFFSPNPDVGSWDHAVSWVSSSAIVGDEVYLYYAGYRWGHKYRRSVDRQVGLLKVQRDRFVARQAGAQGGTLATRPLTLAGDAAHLALNVDAQGGEVRVQITGAAGKPIPGFSFADCRPITVDSLSAPVEWKESLASLRNQPVQLEFSLNSARLYAFETR
jgi:hypothetical protein